jgi:oligopeptide transport system substrate-binding protein
MKEKLKRGYVMLIVGLSALLVFASCSNMQAGTEQELHLASLVSLNTLNHIINTESGNSQVIGNFLEGLLSYDENDNLIASMAESWKTSSDGLTYTFSLRDGIKWSNGEPVTAADFVFGWRTLATDKRAGYVQKLADANIKNAEAVIAGELGADQLGVVAENDKTLVVNLDAPCPFFEKLMAFNAFFPVNEKFYNSVGGVDGFGTSVDTVLANGPFILRTWEPDAQYILEKNEDYWDASNVKLQKISTRIIKELLTHATLYDNGEIDRLIVATDLYDRYKDDPNIVRQGDSAWFYFYLSGNNGNESPVLKNKNFRAAVAHAIDKTLLTEQILKNGALPADYLVPQKFDKLDGVDFRTYANQFNEPIYNPEKAQNYLAQAQAELPGEDLTFELAIAEDATTKQLYENIVSQIEQTLPGVHVTLRTTPSNIFFNMMKEGHTNAGGAGWGADYIDVDTYFSIFRTGDSHNYGQWTNARFDELLEAASNERNEQKRWDHFVAAEKILLEDYSVIPLFQRGVTAVMNPNLKGYRNNPVAPEVFFKYVYFA